MTLRASASSALRALRFSFKRAFFSSINSSATKTNALTTNASARNSGRTFVTVAGVCALLLGGLAAAQSSAPNVKFFASQSVVPTGSLSYPYRVAVDASGNIYISDTQANEVLKETLANGVYTESVIVSTGLATPYGIAVDGSGNVYVVDNGHNRVVEETPSGSSYTQTVISTTTALSYPSGLAVDAAGDLYIADTGGGKILVEKVSGSSYVETALTYSSNFAQLTGIAVDSSGNIYVSDIDNQAVYMETYSAGSYTPSTISVTGLDYPYDIAVDASGNLYISDFSNDRIVLLTNNSGTYTQSVFPTAHLGGALGLAIAANGDVYIADTFGFAIKEIQYAPGNFGPVNVGSPAVPIGMLFQFYGGSGTATLTGTQVLTQGATALDMTAADAGGCSASTSYGPGDFCYVNVAFTPQYPGTRMGAVQLLGASAAVLANGYITGMGMGPQINYTYLDAFFESYVHAVAGPPTYNLTEPVGAAADSSGNIYVVDYVNDAVYEMTPSPGTYTYTQSTIATGFNNPESVAVDGAGNVYVSDSGNNQILLETNSGGSWVQTPIITGLNFPTGVAVDAAGDVYYASFDDGAVYELTFSGGVYSSPIVVVGDLNQPRHIAVDASGNVYIADTGNSRVVKETLSAGSYTQSVIGSGMQYPYGVAVYPNGTVLVADTGHDDILEETLSDGSYTQSEFIPGPTAPDIQIDQMGNVIFPDVDAIVFLISYSQLPNMSFDSTNVGTTSSDSPQTVTITNVGNQPLTATAPGLVVTGPNFVSVAGSGSPVDCGTGFSAAPLAAGASCNLNLSFTPQTAGALTSTAVFTDNALNAPSASQTIPLQGTGLQQSQTITFGAISNMAMGSAPFMLSATASSSLPVSFASLTSGVCTVSGATATLVAVGTCTIQATQAGNAGYSAAAPVSQSFQVMQLSQTITFGTLSNVVLGSAPFALSATASSGLSVSFASTTTSVCTVSGTTATLVAAGTCTIQATQAGNATYAAAAPVSQSFQVAEKSQTITFGTLSNMPLGSAPVTLSATASSDLPVSFASTTTSVCSVSDDTATALAEGTCTIQATQAGNATYAAAAPVSRSFQVTAQTQASQTITFGALSNMALGSAPFTLNATASSELPVSFASTTASVCTVSGVTATLVAAGTCTIQATQAGNSLYTAAAPVSQSFQVTSTSPTSQTIDFGALSNMALGSAPITLSATASSGLAVSFASTTTSICTVSSDTATLVAVGTCTIQATQAGNATYTAAAPVSQSFQVEAATFIMTSNHTTATVTPGQSAVLTITLTPQGSYASPIILSCSGLPADAACSFSPATITPDTKATTTTLTITTASEAALLAPAPLGDRPGPLHATSYTTWLMLPGMLLGMAVLAGPKRRKLQSCCLLFLVAGGCVLQSACAGVSSRNVTPAGSYKITVTGTAGKTQQTVAVTLTVS